MHYVPDLTNAGVWAGSVFVVAQINKRTIRLVNIIEKILVPLKTTVDPAITQALDIFADSAVASFALYNTRLASYAGSILTQNYVGSIERSFRYRNFSLLVYQVDRLQLTCW